jgi:hypothetical protein
VLGPPESIARTGGTALSVQVPGDDQPVTVINVDGSSKELATGLRPWTKAHPSEALVLVGAHGVAGLVDLTARALAKPGASLPVDRILVNAALLKRYRQPSLQLAPLPPNEAPAQMLELQ